MARAMDSARVRGRMRTDPRTRAESMALAMGHRPMGL